MSLLIFVESINKGFIFKCFVNIIEDFTEIVRCPGI